MTLAHELHHVVQRAHSPAVWAAGTLVTSLNCGLLRPLSLTWCDLPHEFEARLVAKRVCEKIWDTDRTLSYINERAAAASGALDISDWACIRAIDTRTEYDLEAEMRRFYPRLASLSKELAEERASRAEFESEFDLVDLDHLLGE